MVSLSVMNECERSRTHGTAGSGCWSLRVGYKNDMWSTVPQCHFFFFCVVTEQ